MWPKVRVLTGRMGGQAFVKFQGLSLSRNSSCHSPIPLQMWVWLHKLLKWSMGTSSTTNHLSLLMDINQCNDHSFFTNVKKSLSNCSHAIVGRSSRLWRYPVDVLTGAFDITSHAMNAVLSIDLQSLSTLVLVRDKLIHPSRAEVLLWSSKHCQIPLHRERVISQGEMWRLVMIMVGTCITYTAVRADSTHRPTCECH